MQGIVKQINDKGQWATWWSEDEIDAALCLWEECIRRRQLGDDEFFDWLRGGEGAANARDMCVQLAKDCETSYQVARECGFDDSFDWEFVPLWVNLAITITNEHEMKAPWIDYMGRRIYYDWKDAMSHLGWTNV